MPKKKKRGRRHERSAAIVTIFDADKMTEHGRKNIAAWLRQHAAWLLKHGSEYSKRFTGRYLY